MYSSALSSDRESKDQQVFIIYNFVTTPEPQSLGGDTCGGVGVTTLCMDHLPSVGKDVNGRPED